jgi:tRNA nucleotidyltransferase/poly(A) polymerase/2'-5' RNA ligase
MSKIENFRNVLINKPFIKSIINDLRGECYAVGGVVRDLILNKPNKDIDLVIRNVPIDKLILQLQKFGKVDVVGKSFGVIKFIDSDGIEYDLALPRTEKKNNLGGYRGFNVQSDPNLSVDDELFRRDAKLNAMAINLNTGKFIDPLGGLEDIEKKQISAANPEAFSDDPLRMLRMVGFASRFGFTIEPKTMQLIQQNAQRIKEIPPERILTEFEKIVKKGNKRVGAQLLKNTGLYNQIFGSDLKQSVIDRSPFEDIKTMGEFIYLLIRLKSDPATFYKNNLKGDIDTFKEIKAIDIAYNSSENSNSIKAKAVAHNMYALSPQSLQSKILPNIIEIAAQELLTGKYPKILGDLAINGNDLTEIGFKSKEIGNMLKSLLLNIYADKIKNNKEELLNFAEQNKSRSGEVFDGIAVYSGVILDEESRQKLIKVFSRMIPKDWEIITHHMTIKTGRLDPDSNEKKDIENNKTVELSVLDYAMDDKVMAVGVKGYPSQNTKPHITLGVNRNDDGKPAMSNNLTNWKPLGFPLKLTGKVREIEEEIKNVNVINENDNIKIEYGSLMLNLNIPNWIRITSIINKNDIYNEEGFGIENEPHLTILYGFHNNVTANDVFDLYKSVTKLKPIKIITTGISSFENNEFDVVKLDVEVTNFLKLLNKNMREFPNTNEFNEYNPHVTISYVKKGCGKKYNKVFKNKINLIGDELVFSTKKNKQKKIKLNKEKE